MMINQINPYQGLQNAIRPGGSNSSSDDNRQVLSSDRSAPAPRAGVETSSARLLGIAERVNALQKQWNLNEVKDPPFFPIATYQRMDLISEVRNIQVEVERSSLSPEIKQAVSGEKLKDDANDQQIANAVDNLKTLRDTLSRSLAVSKDNIQPGSILKLEA
jgi:hypothetical protein